MKMLPEPTFKKAVISILCLITFLGPGCSAAKNTQQTITKSIAKVAPGLKTGAAASVNGELIMVSSVDEQVKRIELQKKTPEQAQAYDVQKLTIRSQILDLLIDEELYKQKAKEFKIEISDQDVDNELEATKKRFPTLEEFNKAMSDAGMTTNDLRVFTKNRMLQEKVDSYIVANKLGPNGDEWLKGVRLKADIKIYK